MGPCVPRCWISRAARCAWRRCRSPNRVPTTCCSEVPACGACRTDLHILDGELPRPRLPLVLGHQIVGARARGGERAGLRAGDRVGVPWLGWTCGECHFCRSGRENLCDRARFTGYMLDGGFAERAVADARFCFPLPGRLRRRRGRAAAVRRADRLPGAAHAPATPSASGSTASAPRRTSSPRSRSTRDAACSRSPAPGDEAAQAFARELGAEWAGDADEPRPSRSTRRSSSPRSESSCPPRCARSSKRRRRRLRRDPHERHPVVPLRAAVGRALRALGRQPHAGRRTRAARAWRRASRSARGSPRSLSTTPRTR